MTTPTSWALSFGNHTENCWFPVWELTHFGPDRSKALAMTSKRLCIGGNHAVLSIKTAPKPFVGCRIGTQSGIVCKEINKPGMLDINDITNIN